MKLWNKNPRLNKAIEKFTIGKDQQLDLILAPYDGLFTAIHVKMLKETNLLSETETRVLLQELRVLYIKAKKGELRIKEGVEDIHSQVEELLTEKLGETGKKIHTARSRNDQVLLDLKLFSRHQISTVSDKAYSLFKLLTELSEKHKEVHMPGYTHLQAAMPSSFGLWFGAFAESLTDDMIMLSAAYRIINQNPLGSAAGYGSAFPIRREITTELLGFDDLVYNSIYAQMGRTKTEKIVAFALSSVAATLSKLAMDLTLFMSQNFGFVSFPDEFITGSSIMPHKKNPDVLELIRAKCNKVQALPNEISLISSNLPTGYHRDHQILKDIYLPSFSILIDCLEMSILILEHIQINKKILEDDRYQYIFSVEEINNKVKTGTPFREAYHEVAESIASGSFQTDKTIDHTHKGSIGNLCNYEIKQKMEKIISEFNFYKAERAIEKLIQ